MQDVCRRRAAGELAIDARAIGIDHVPNPHHRRHRERALVDVAVDAGVRVAVDDAGRDVLAGGVDDLAFASRAFTFGPISAILPLRIRIEPLLIVPCEAVIIVAFLISVSAGRAAATAEPAPAASFALAPVCANTEATIANVSSADRIALVFFIIPPSPIADCGLRIADLNL